MTDKLKDMLLEIAGLTVFDPKDLVRRCLKLTEEVGELAQAILSMEGTCEYKGLGIDQVNEELADVLLVLVSIILQANGGDVNKVLDLVPGKLAKWRRILGVEES